MVFIAQITLLALSVTSTSLPALETVKCQTHGEQHAKPHTATARQVPDAMGESALMWEKMSDKILESINKRFDLLNNKIETHEHSINID